MKTINLLVLVVVLAIGLLLGAYASRNTIQYKQGELSIQFIDECEAGLPRDKVCYIIAVPEDQLILEKTI